MMRSLFSGVSGLKSHQTRMDVVGNNIANINTVGFKSSRVTFADVLSQTQSGAASPTDNIGGTNPKQIGLGVGIGSIDLIFTDGSPQATGKNSDIALSGNGLFVVKNGNSTYYTRNGAFEYDANGYYVLPGSGYKVQGWNAVNGSLNTNSLPTDIIVPAGKTMPAAATTQVRFSGNLNAAEPLISSFNGTDSFSGNPLDVKKNTTIHLDDGTSAVAPDVGYYTIGHSMPISTIVSVYDSLGTAHSIPMWIERCPEEDIEEKFTSTSSSDEDSGDDTEDSSTTDTNVEKKLCWRITLAYDKTKKFTDTYVDENGYVHTYNTYQTATNINLDDGTIVSMTDPIYIYFNTDGSYSHLVQEKGSAANTLSDLRHRTTEGDAVTGEEGEESVEESSDDSSTVYGGHARDGAVNPGAAISRGSENIPVPTYSGGNPDKLAKKGDETTTTDDDGGDSDTGEGGRRTTLYRDDDTDTGKAMLVLKYTQTYSTAGGIQGAADQKIDYYNSSTKQLEDTRVTIVFDDPSFPLTQYTGGSSAQPVSVDGNPYGILSSVSADTSGIITGTYTNGQRRFEAQIAVAQFINPAGLTKAGNNLYQESNNSGSANIKTAPDLGVNVTPSSLEMSNVDLANEFSEMIITQRGFQANSKIINVGDEMLETLVNMKR